MQFSSLRSRAVLISLVLLVFVSLNVFQSGIRNFFYSLSSPLHSFFWSQGRGFSDFFLNVFKAGTLKQENEFLQGQVHFLTQQLVLFEEQQKENEELRKALGLGIQKNFEVIATNILARDAGEDSVLIDKGADAGIGKGMTVITPSSVLIGKIGEVFENFSKVLLLSNPSSSFDAKVTEKDVSGLVKGEGRSRVAFSLVPKEKSLEKGDVVITSKLGGVFPENLLVGEVESVSSNPADSFQLAYLKLFSETEDPVLLFIITNEK